MSGKHFSRGRPLLDLNRMYEQGALLRGRSTRRTCPITRRGPKGKGARRMWKTAKDHARILGRYSTVGTTFCIGFGGRRLFSRRGFSVPLHSTKTCKTCILANGDDSSVVGQREEPKHALSPLQSACELSKVVTLGPESSQSWTISFLGRTLTLRQWRIEYEMDQKHVSRAFEGFGTDRFS